MPKFMASLFAPLIDVADTPHRGSIYLEERFEWLCIELLPTNALLYLTVIYNHAAAGRTSHKQSLMLPIGVSCTECLQWTTIGPPTLDSRRRELSVTV